MVQKNGLGKILIICGPTASSKTALAIECAKKLETEIISADAFYIYKGLNIGTAKPTEKETDGIKHHLIDVVTPFDAFTVSDYRRLAIPIIDGLIARGKTPIVCGGTGFYINSLLYNLSYGNGEGNGEVREKYKAIAVAKGNEYVYGLLQKLDPESAARIHANDLKRVIRALEIYESGIKKSEIKDDMTPRYDYKAYSVAYPRDELYSRINTRVDSMLENGFVREVKDLIDAGVTMENQCMQAIGYKELFAYLSGGFTLDEAVERIKINTRHYAKRQITFFKRLENLTYLEPADVKTLAERIVREL